MCVCVHCAVCRMSSKSAASSASAYLLSLSLFFAPGINFLFPSSACCKPTNRPCAFENPWAVSWPICRLVGPHVRGSLPLIGVFWGPRRLTNGAKDANLGSHAAVVWRPLPIYTLAPEGCCVDLAQVPTKQTVRNPPQRVQCRHLQARCTHDTFPCPAAYITLLEGSHMVTPPLLSPSFFFFLIWILYSTLQHLIFATHLQHTALAV